MTVIELPWPDKNLFPNARPHWAQKARAVKKARAIAAQLALVSGIRRDAFAGHDSLSISLIFAPPNKIRRDIDGMLSACKGYLDGIADHIGLDDSKFVFEKMYRTEPCRPGWVKVKISAVEANGEKTKCEAASVHA